MAELKLLTVEIARDELRRSDVRSAEVRVGELDVHLDGEGAVFLVHAGRPFKVGDRFAECALRALTGVDGKLLMELGEDPDLVGLAVQHSLSKRKDERARIVTAQRDLIDMMRPTVPWLAPEEVFDTTVRTLGQDLLGLESVRSDKRHTAMRFVTGHKAEPPKRRGDLSHAGVLIRCNGQFESFAYVVRLACVNGLLGERTVAVQETRETIVESLRAQTREALARSRQLLEGFVALDDHGVENPGIFLTQLARTTGMGDRQTRRLLEAVPTLPANPTRYDVVNLVTAKAHDRGEERFELLGVQAMQAFAQETCSHCARPV